MGLYNPPPPLVIENARIFWRNFAGKEGPYNSLGSRNFCVEIPESIASKLIEDGWNVKLPKPRDSQEEGEPRQPYIAVNVSYKGRPPRVVMITSRGRTPLDEDLVELLDGVEIENVDISVNPSHWEIGGRGGIKGYLKTMYIKIREDPLDIKWAEEAPPGDNANE